MNDKEKKAFNEMADKDRIRYEREMKSYVPPAGTGKKTKKKKDPNAPKRPQYIFFSLFLFLFYILNYLLHVYFLLS